MTEKPDSCQKCLNRFFNKGKSQKGFFLVFQPTRVLLSFQKVDQKVCSRTFLDLYVLTKAKLGHFYILYKLIILKLTSHNNTLIREPKGQSYKTLGRLFWRLTLLHWLKKAPKSFIKLSPVRQLEKGVGLHRNPHKRISSRVKNIYVLNFG